MQIFLMRLRERIVRIYFKFIISKTSYKTTHFLKMQYFFKDFFPESLGIFYFDVPDKKTNYQDFLPPKHEHTKYH